MILWSTNAARRAAVTAALVTVLTAGWSCGPPGAGRGDWSGDDRWDAAVTAFISGDFEGAATRFEALAADADSEEQRREAYWYLGRSYAELGQHSRAIDAFTIGKAHGGGPEFDQYLRQLDALVSGAPEAVVRSDHVTRAQLAVLIDKMFYQATVDSAGSPEGTADGEWEGLAPVARGIVGNLPDGRFHPVDKVTRAGFYVAVCRLVEDRRIELDPSELFAGGFDWALDTGANGDRMVTGKEAVTALRRVASAKTTYGGQGS